jgi:multiple sugar transport system permease protein
MKHYQLRLLLKLLLTGILLFCGLLMVLPFVWAISTSFKSPSEVFDFPIRWIPETFIFDHHVRVWTANGGFLPFYLNSVKVAFISTVGAVLMSALAAYGFSRIEFKGRDACFLLYLSMMMVPPQILFVPKFLMFDWAGIYNTHLALILPGLFSIFGVFMMRQFFLKIPMEISESAMMDGAGHFRIFARLILPLSKPVLATFSIIDFSWHWNDYENALVFLIDKDLYTIPLGLQNFIQENSIDYNGMMAAASAAIIPMLIVFFAGQKYIIQGVAGTAVKG